MKKNIKDYLPFHLGCKVITTGGKCGVLVSVSTTGGVTIVYENEDPRGVALDCRAIKHLVLRPLSDMTDEEGKSLATAIYRTIFNYGNLKLDGRYEDGSDNVGFVLIDQDGERVGFSVETERGIEFSYKSDKLMVRQFDVSHALLSQHFDLFDLIEAGLAIDKTTV